MAFSVFSNSKNIKRAKEAAGAQQMAGLYALEGAKSYEDMVAAGEAAKMNVFSMLGAKGTYGPDATTTALTPADTAGIFDTSGRSAEEIKALKKLAPYGSHAGKRDLLEGPRENIVDPAGYANAMSKTAGFQIQSQLVGEARDLLAREGPGWERLSNATLGTINEGSALMLRDTLRQLKNNYAKGGSARRTALNEANTILAQESAMRARVQETWQANLRLDEYVRVNAERVQEGTARWLDGLPLISNAYREAMNAAAVTKIQAAGVSAQISGASYEIAQSQQARNVGGKLVEAVVGVVASAVASYYGGPGAGAAVGGAITGTSAPTSSAGNQFDFSNLFSAMGAGSSGLTGSAATGVQPAGKPAGGGIIGPSMMGSR